MQHRVSLSSTVLIFFGLLCSCQEDKTVYINPAKLTESYKGAIYAHQAFMQKSKIWQANIDSLKNELSISPVKEKNIKEQQLLQYSQAIQQKAQNEEVTLREGVLNKINEYIKQYGKQKGYDFILGATDSGNIIYAAEGKDITEEVLKGLNEQYDKQHATKP